VLFREWFRSFAVLSHDAWRLAMSSGGVAFAMKFLLADIANTSQRSIILGDVLVDILGDGL
jgi:hypothetical protein